MKKGTLLVLVFILAFLACLIAKWAQLHGTLSGLEGIGAYVTQVILPSAISALGRAFCLTVGLLMMVMSVYTIMKPPERPSTHKR